MGNPNLRKNTEKNGKNWKREQGNYLPSNTYAAGYLPPQDQELERAVLGAVMLEKGAFDTIADILSADVFYVEAHQKIYQSFLRLAEKYQPIDMLTVINDLKERGELELIGGMFYIMTLTKEVVSAANIEAHSRIIVQKHIGRELIRIGSMAMNEAFRQEIDVFELMDTVGNELFTLASGHVKRECKSIASAYNTEIRELSTRCKAKQDVTGVPTGFRSIDVLTAGWQLTDLIIIAARPSVGKTAFAINLALNAAFHPIKPVNASIFTLEMSNGQITQRIMAAAADIRLDSIRRGKLEEWELANAMAKWDGQLINEKIFLDDTPGITLMELRAKARRLVSKNNVGVIVIDYLQLMSGEEGGRTGNREQEISRISRGLKGLAKELGVPILALSQLSRDVEKRGSKEPVLSDLRESGAIEQDADVVAFLYRDDYQKEDSQVDVAIRGNTYLKFAKHRNGQLETIALKANLSIQKFAEPDFLEGADKKYIPLHEANALFSGPDDMPF